MDDYFHEKIKFIEIALSDIFSDENATKPGEELINIIDYVVNRWQVEEYLFWVDKRALKNETELVSERLLRITKHEKIKEITVEYCNYYDNSSVELKWIRRGSEEEVTIKNKSDVDSSDDSSDEFM